MTWLLGPAILATGVVEDAAVAIVGDRIAIAGSQSDASNDFGPNVVHLERDQLLAPGFVDLHCHGGNGATFGADEAQSARAAAFHHRRGTTSVMASLVSDQPEGLVAAAGACGRLAARGEVLGIHLEGPFISAERRGAHDLSTLRDVDLGLLDDVVRAAAGAIRVVTYAPELERATDLVDALLRYGILPAVGHTDADAATVAAALDHVRAGGRRPLVTHLFNAMPAWQGRAPGPVSAALEAAARGHAVVELIADGVHLEAATVSAVFAIAAPGCVALVSDAIVAAGSTDGQYLLGGLDVTVASNVARLTEGGSLAGSTATLADIVRRCLASGLDVRAVISAATDTPAAVLGLAGEVGSIQGGLRADLVVLDGDFIVTRVMRAGAWLDAPTVGVAGNG